jgi:nucleoside phosphorylase
MNKAIVILTAIPEEQEAVIKGLADVKIVRHSETGTDYYEGYLSTKDSRVKIVVGRTNQTNINAATETERVINYFHPSHIFYIGVAGGLKDVKVGDIVIGEEVIGYERGKAEKLYKPRFQFGISSYDLSRAAFAFSISEKWKSIRQTLLDTKFHYEIRAYIGTIASGEKVVASEEADLYKFIKTNISQALAIEMEGLGFLNVCRAHPEIKSLLLRGISDLINDKGEKDGMGSQPYASQNVAAFTLGLITDLGLIQLESFEEKSVKEKLFEIACKLYPRGLEDKGIWSRAGGDLSQVMLSSQGKAQWIDGLRLIEHGGGGNISFSKLIAEMMEDAPNNSALIGLKKHL